jgi:hypothetical protein
MVRQAHHERNQQRAVRPEPVEGSLSTSLKTGLSKGRSGAFQKAVRPELVEGQVKQAYTFFTNSDFSPI